MTTSGLSPSISSKYISIGETHSATLPFYKKEMWGKVMGTGNAYAGGTRDCLSVVYEIVDSDPKRVYHVVSSKKIYDGNDLKNLQLHEKVHRVFVIEGYSAPWVVAETDKFNGQHPRGLFIPPFKSPDEHCIALLSNTAKEKSET